MTINPFGPRIAVVEPHLEQQTASGLIVVSNEVEVDTGVCVANPSLEGDGYGLGPTPLAQIKLGALVYYIKGTGVRIGDQNIIEIKAIIAWEEF